MAIKPRRPCNRPGCRQLTDRTYCAEHEQQYKREKEQYRGSFRERGYSSTWDKVRKHKIKINPLCEMCERDGRVTVAEIVHHIKTVRDRPDLVHDMDNLMSVCRPCHGKLHSNEK